MVDSVKTKHGNNEKRDLCAKYILEIYLYSSTPVVVLTPPFSYLKNRPTTAQCLTHPHIVTVCSCSRTVVDVKSDVNPTVQWYSTYLITKLTLRKKNRTINAERHLRRMACLVYDMSGACYMRARSQNMRRTTTMAMCFFRASRCKLSVARALSMLSPTRPPRPPALRWYACAA